LQGGASLGFSISALNMMRSTKKAAYINTGTWSKKAMTEAKKAGFDVIEAASSADTNFNYIPKSLNLNDGADYLHFTSNNTIFGTQFKEMPSTSLPLVCDMSSDIFSREINVANFDLIYAGAQKNMGPAGTTLYIVKDEALGKSSSDFMPTYLDLKTHADKDSMFNTPPVFPVYASMLNLRNLINNGGVKAAQQRNEAKAALLYNEIDSNPLFEGTVASEDRSNMNVTFLMKDESRIDEFNALWQQNDLVGLKGHRSVGGFRASMYNALPIESVQVLVDLMKHFSSKG
jgi:phosphoserine aminotransferase